MRQYSKGAVHPTLREAADAAVSAYVRAPRMAGVATPITQPRGLMPRLRALETAHGGEKAAAAAAGVTPRTWRGWKSGTKPTGRSLAGVQGAYERDLDRRSQTPARRHAEARRMAADGHQAYLGVKAEIQWAGYYNGQADRSRPSGPATEAFAPEYGRHQAAHRELKATDSGTGNVSRLLLAWAAGRSTARVLDEMLNDEHVGKGIDPVIFLNWYFTGAEVILR
jgi:hypothetical protein